MPLATTVMDSFLHNLSWPKFVKLLYFMIGYDFCLLFCVRLLSGQINTNNIDSVILTKIWYAECRKSHAFETIQLHTGHQISEMFVTIFPVK